MKKSIVSVLVLALLSALLLTSLFSCNKSGKDLPVVGIGQFGEHPSLDNCRLGFIEGLRQEGFIEGETVRFDYKNASFSGDACTTIAKNYVSDRVDLICAIATPMAQAAFNNAEEAKIPVVFTAITDPVESKLDKGNVTGTSDMLPVEAQLKMIRALMPTAKKIGILYTTSESNSIAALAIYKSLASAYGFEIVDRGVTSGADVALATQAIVGEVDCFSNLTDNTVVGMLQTMLDITTPAGKPIFGSEIEQVKNGCAAAEGIEYYQLGIQTGKMAAKILRGEATAENMPYETVKDHFFYVNNDVLKTFGITLSGDYASSAIDALTYGN